jgi:hypothetical protein
MALMDLIFDNRVCTGVWKKMNYTNISIDVYLEVGEKKTFAGSIDWSGWCRWGREEASALHDLLHYGPRYASVLGNTQLGFIPPSDVSEFDVVERLTGNKTTDFGAPDIAPGWLTSTRSMKVLTWARSSIN